MCVFREEACPDASLCLRGRGLAYVPLLILTGLEGVSRDVYEGPAVSEGYTSTSRTKI